VQTSEELWSALDSSGASARYALLLNSATIETLEPFFQVAAQVRTRPALIAPLIGDVNWRITLVGTALAVLVREETLTESMVERLVSGSWVAPQLAAGIASMPHAGAQLDPLREFLAQCTLESDPKSCMSAYAALSLLGDPIARTFDATPVFAELWKRDDVGCQQIAARWRGIWQIVGPYFRLRFGLHTDDDAVR
jgi:hypothetical protein